MRCAGPCLRQRPVGLATNSCACLAALARTHTHKTWRLGRGAPRPFGHQPLTHVTRCQCATGEARVPTEEPASLAARVWGSHGRAEHAHAWATSGIAKRSLFAMHGFITLVVAKQVGGGRAHCCRNIDNVGREYDCVAHG